MKIIQHIVVLLCLTCVLHGQDRSINFDFQAGKIWKHKAALFYQTPPVSGGFQIKYLRPLKADPYWSKAWSHPKVGIAALFMSFGDQAVLGHAVGILPIAEFSIFSRGQSDLVLSNGFGIARLSQTFNEVNNPTNNAIGSHINNISKLGLTLHHRFNGVSLYAGGNFTHFSNGGSQSPNSGINVITGILGFKKQLGVETADYKSLSLENSAIDTAVQKKIGLNLNWHTGLYEDDVPNGPKYLIQAVSSTVFKAFSPKYRLHLGFEFEYNAANYHFAKNTFQSEQDSKRSARQFIFVVANEFFLVDYSFRFQTGFYTNYPSDFGNGAFYFKLISQYHFQIPKVPFKTSIGVMMKSHWAKAENIGLVFGVDF